MRIEILNPKIQSSDTVLQTPPPGTKFLAPPLEAAKFKQQAIPIINEVVLVVEGRQINKYLILNRASETKLFRDFYQRLKYGTCCFSTDDLLNEVAIDKDDTRSGFEIEEGDSWQGIEESTCPDELPDGQYKDSLRQDDDFDGIDTYNADDNFDAIDAYNDAEGEMPTASFEADSELGRKTVRRLLVKLTFGL
ncbi:hypothetical protein V8E54_010537 [Elaphomyces granulatus]